MKIACPPVGNETSERIEEALRAYSEGGVEAMLPFVHPEFSMTTTAEIAAEPDTYQGHDGIRRYFESFFEVMDKVEIEPLEIESRGESGMVRFKLVARGRATGDRGRAEGIRHLRVGRRPDPRDPLLHERGRAPCRVRRLRLIIY